MTVRSDIQQVTGDPPSWVWKLLLPVTVTAIVGGFTFAWSINATVSRHDVRLGAIESLNAASDRRDEDASNRLRALEQQVTAIGTRTENTDDRVREILQILREERRASRTTFPNP